MGDKCLLTVQYVCFFLYGSELKSSILNCLPEFSFFEKILLSKRFVVSWWKWFDIGGQHTVGHADREGNW